ncbi:hypothetical protein CY35_05G103300 [Sphagnum magellanicum]|nr:hypothetical protein CY35_05G103300 [Sphagnum magellanicum]
MHSWDGYLQASVYTSHDEKCFSSWRFLQWTCMCCTHNWVVCLCLISCNHNLITEPLSNTSTKSVFCSCTRHLAWQMQWVVARCCRDPTSSSQSKQFMILRNHVRRVAITAAICALWSQTVIAARTMKTCV